MKTLVVGFGSPFGDDRIGWDVIDELERHLKQNPDLDVTLFKSKGSGFDWLNVAADAEQAIFVDAVKSNKQPGYIHHIRFDENTITSELPTFSSHGVALVDVIHLTRNAELFSQPVAFYGVEIPDQISAKHAEMLQQAKQQLLERLLLEISFPEPIVTS